MSASARRQRAERKGRVAEWLACGWLIVKGYQICAVRFKSPLGEADIIARKSDILVFVEVKARHSIDSAIEAVTPKSQQRIAAAAGLYIARNRAFERFGIRYDIIAIAGWRARHIRDAWRDQM